MRWIPFLIFAYLAVGFQIGLSGFIDVKGVRPNLPLLLAVFVAIHAAREPGLLGCFMIGAMQDLVSGRPMGLYAFAYGTFSIILTAAQASVYREHPLTHVALSLGTSLWTEFVVILSGVRHAPRHSLGDALGVSIYTAVASVVVIGLLVQSRRLFGFHSSRRPVGSIRTLRRK